MCQIYINIFWYFYTVVLRDTDVLPDPPNIILLSSQNIIFQFVDQMLLMMEPFGNGEIDDDVDEIEPTMVSLFSFWHSMSSIIRNRKFEIYRTLVLVMAKIESF